MADMDNVRVIILARNPAWAAAIRLEVLAAGAIPAEEINTRMVGESPMTDEVSAAYTQIAEWLELRVAGCTRHELPRVPVVATDLHVEPAMAQPTWNALDGGGWIKVLALLMVSFPELSWRLAPGGVRLPIPKGKEEGSDEKEETPEGKEDRQSQIWRAVHSMEGAWVHDLEELWKECYIPWFDATGLRTVISNAIPFFGHSSAAPEAVSIDDECSFALFHAYVAYRNGYRCHVVCTTGHLHRLLGKQYSTRHPLSLIMEDRELDPLDCKAEDWGDQAKKVEKLPGLKQAADGLPKVVTITYGHLDGHKSTTTQVSGNPSLILKPVGGMADLWTQIESRAGTTAAKRERSRSAWLNNSHNAPGRLRHVAARMVTRARHLRANSQTQSATLLAAVLAAEAGELLKNVPPAAALDALLVQQTAEVQSECQFAGLSFNLKVVPRLEVIERRCDKICSWYPEQQRAQRALGAALDLVREVTLVFRSYNQFDEEQHCLNRSRSLLRRHWIVSQQARLQEIKAKESLWNLCWWTGSVLLTALAGFVAWPYWNWLLEKWYRTFYSLLGWLVLLIVPFIKCGTVMEAEGAGRFVTGIARAFGTLFSVQTIADDALPNWITAVAMVVGYFHLGLLVTHLYQLSLRK